MTTKRYFRTVHPDQRIEILKWIDRNSHSVNSQVWMGYGAGEAMISQLRWRTVYLFGFPVRVEVTTDVTIKRGKLPPVGFSGLNLTQLNVYQSRDFNDITFGQEIPQPGDGASLPPV